MVDQLIRSVLEQDRAPVVLCDLQHTIRYMNPAAGVAYGKYGGLALLGKNLLLCHKESSVQKLLRVLQWFAKDPANNCVHTFYDRKENKDVYVIALRNAQGELIGYYEKTEERNVDTTALYEMF